MNKLKALVVVVLVFLLAACQVHTASTPETPETSAPIAPIADDPTTSSEPLPIDDAAAEGDSSSTEPTNEEQYAACVNKAFSGEPVRLAFSPTDFDRALLFVMPILFETGEIMWDIQREDNRAMLVALVSESDLYLCPDNFIELRGKAYRMDDCDDVLFLAPDARDYTDAFCRIVTDGFGVYVYWHGAYYIPTDDRADEIAECIYTLTYDLADYISQLVRPYSDRRLDPLFVLPIGPEDTADAF